MGEVGIKSYKMYHRTNLNIFKENRPDFSETCRRSFSKLTPPLLPTCPESDYRFMTVPVSDSLNQFKFLVTLLVPASYFSPGQPVYFYKIAVSRVIRTDPAK